MRRIDVVAQILLSAVERMPRDDAEERDEQDADEATEEPESRQS